MTFGVPYSFVPGTKAKADEVNANFIDVLSKIEDTNLRIDETISSADSRSAEVATKFEEVESKIDERVDLNLSNISTKGLALFEAKANVSDIDGQWVAKLVTLADDVILSNSNSTIYSLADYLPNDGNIYEVIISMAGNFGGLGHYNINTGYNTLLGICGKSAVSYCITMPISTARELRFYPTSSCSGTNKLGIRVTAYRKVR